MTKFPDSRSHSLSLPKVAISRFTAPVGTRNKCGAAKPFAHSGDEVGDADRLGVGDKEHLAFSPERGERKLDGRGEVVDRQKRAAIVEPAEGKRHWRLRQRGEAAILPSTPRP